MRMTHARSTHEVRVRTHTSLRAKHLLLLAPSTRLTFTSTPPSPFVSSAGDADVRPAAVQIRCCSDQRYDGHLRPEPVLVR